MDCADGSGLEIGDLSSSSVVFDAFGRSLRIVGVLGTRLPFRLFDRAPRSGVVAIRRGRVVVTTAWFGRYDATCCPSRHARTIWRYEHGRLRPGATQILEHPWSSPLSVNTVLVGKPPEALSPQREIVQRVVASDRIRVLVANEAHAAKQNVTVSVTVAQPGLRIARTCTIARVAAYRSVAGTAVFSGFGRVRLGVRSTLTVTIHDRGTQPVRYRVVFVRR